MTATGSGTGSTAPDLDAGVVERPAEPDLRLADADADLGNRKVGQELMADRLGEGLEQAEGRRFHDLAGGAVDLRVVNHLRQIVIKAYRLKIEQKLDVDLERLRRHQLVIIIAMTTLELHVREDDPVAQARPPSAGAMGRQVPRMIASAVRATRTLARTSWTRIMSTPAAMPRAVVASVASTR